jgi:chromosome segregation ATPase
MEYRRILDLIAEELGRAELLERRALKAEKQLEEAGDRLKYLGESRGDAQAIEHHRQFSRQMQERAENVEKANAVLLEDRHRLVRDYAAVKRAYDESGRTLEQLCRDVEASREEMAKARKERDERFAQYNEMLAKKQMEEDRADRAEAKLEEVKEEMARLMEKIKVMGSEKK